MARALSARFSQLSELKTVLKMAQESLSTPSPSTSGHATPLQSNVESGASSRAADWLVKSNLDTSSPTTSGHATPLESNPEAGPSTRVADKWVKPNGPPVGSTFGARYLKEDDDVWNHNAWDHVELPEDFHERAAEIIERHRSSPVAAALRDDYNDRPAHYWDQFYAKHKEMFFKDRGWLRLEFPELVATSEPDAGPKVVLEVGCGAGNTVFPVLMHNENPDLLVYATDYSKEAVEVVKSNPMYPTPLHGKGKMRASVWDITSTGVDGGSALPEGIEEGSVDVITVIYVLSALHPNQWDQAIHNLYTALKPGGLLLVRDYGRHDLAQLRIKKDRMLDVDNLYIRGDGTRVYFFQKEELQGLVARPHGQLRAEGQNGDLRRLNGDGQKDMFEVYMSGVDRRLIVNRKEKKQMYRIWLQLKAKKTG